MKFKIGDKVKVIESDAINHSDINMIGTIVENGSNSYDYTVAFDRTYPFTHGCNGKCPARNGRYYNERQLELVPAIANKIVITVEGNTTLARLYSGKKVIKSAEAKCSPCDTFDFMTGAKLAIERLLTNEVNRTAKVGEYVKVMSEGGHRATIHSILKVEHVYDDGWVKVCLENDNSTTLRREQYVVIEGYEPEPEPEKYYNGKVVCIDNIGNIGAYTIGKIYQFEDGILTADNGSKMKYYDKPIKSFEEWQKFSSSKWLEVKE